MNRTIDPGLIKGLEDERYVLAGRGQHQVCVYRGPRFDERARGTQEEIRHQHWIDRRLS
jgi:hypothetical protein